VFGVEIIRDASKWTLISRSGVLHELTVAEACSGMHLLMAFLALGIATAYLEARPVWQRSVLVLAALPIAVFCNVLRVAITCSMYYIDKKEFGQNVLHTFTGMLMLIPAFAMLWILGWVLGHLFVEADDDDDAKQPEGSATEEAAI
jgi:exosortase